MNLEILLITSKYNNGSWLIINFQVNNDVSKFKVRFPSKFRRFQVASMHVDEFHPYLKNISVQTNANGFQKT